MWWNNPAGYGNLPPEDQMPTIMIVDDIPALAEQYAYDLRRIGGYRAIIATGGRDALEMIAGEPVDCMILDLEMPEVDGFDVLRSLSENRINIPVIVYTGTGNYERCVQAVKLGAYGFIDKNEPMERVAREVANALELGRLRSEVDQLRQSSGAGTSIVGSSGAVEKLRERIERVAGIPSPVLITGESGTGKELVAREIHRLGTGEDTPFVPVNSAALPENLIESELFGHERGAFTGASRVRRGAFERAEEGVIFLDEIGELPLQAQAKLLRVLEQREVTRIGGEKVISVSARVVAATNRDLERLIDKGSFRKDLFFRLNVHIIDVPPLRERISDIPELAGHFLQRICSKFGIPEKRINPRALEELMNYHWKRNNIRELRNIIERMVIAAPGNEIHSSDITASLSPIVSAGKEYQEKTLKEMKREAERRIIVQALDRNGWHITKTASELGLSDHSSLIKIMKRLNISKK
ncbi:MAG: response regulator [Candidatus Latescibacteria bacterium]|nr:response regulator [bacterium]MBD3424957.1 response regulator [Candidatus Latescibacterota bacterium]